MPKITIPATMDAEFLASTAALNDGWGVDGTKFSFLTKDLLKVDQALTDYPAAYLARRKAQKLEEIATIRKTKELLGPNGLVLDDKTSLRLSAAALTLIIDQARQSYRWELSRGVFMTLPRNTVLGLAVAATNHVQLCFDNVYNHTTAVQAVTLDPEAEEPYEDLLAKLEILDAIDITVGWPG